MYSCDEYDDAGTRGRGDAGTRGRGDAGTEISSVQPVSAPSEEPPIQKRAEISKMIAIKL